MAARNTIALYLRAVPTCDSTLQTQSIGIHGVTRRLHKRGVKIARFFYRWVIQRATGATLWSMNRLKMARLQNC